MKRQVSTSTNREQMVESIPAGEIMLREQKARDEALTRFNRLFVYGPLALGALLAIVLLGLLGWFALTGEAGSLDRAQASGIADVFVTMVCLAPLALVGAGVAGAGLFFLYWRRQRGSLVREKLHGALRNVDSRLDSADTRAKAEQTRVVNNTIKYRNMFEAFSDKLYYQTAQISKWINEKLAKNRD